MKLKSVLFALAGVAVLLAGPGCAHVKDCSRARHEIIHRAAVLPPGWTVVSANLTNTATGNAVVETPLALQPPTNAPAGFWASLVAPSPRIYRDWRESWQDDSAGGGTFLFTDPAASQLAFARSNQTALGGNHTASVGTITSVITTNAVNAIGTTGTAAGNVIGAALKKATTATP